MGMSDAKYFQHNLLPADARAILRRAAMTHIPANDPLARLKAIEAATERVKQLYPSYFVKEL